MPLLDVTRYRSGEGGLRGRRDRGKTGGRKDGSDRSLDRLGLDTAAPASDTASPESEGAITSLSPFGDELVDALSGGIADAIDDGNGDEPITAYSHHNGSNGFRNPWTSFKNVGLSDFLTAFGLSSRGGGAETPSEPLSASARLSGLLSRNTAQPKEVPGVCPDFDKERSLASSCRATWLGHATYLVELPVPEDQTGRTARGVTVLFDPMFSSKSSPSQYLGPTRLVPMPCHPNDLPPIDVVLISHNHYDHLDLGSILTLERNAKKAARSIHYFVPLGHLSWFVESGIKAEQVTEMDWWDSATFRVTMGKSTDRASFQSVDLSILCVPAQHGSGRGLSDQNSCLWASWYVSQGMPLKKAEDRKDEGDTSQNDQPPPFAVYFAGDTGYRYMPPQTKLSDVKALEYCPIFKQLADYYRPPTLALLPISNGSTLSYLRRFGVNPFSPNQLTSSIHSNPADAVAIHLDLKARYSCPMHYGTFVSGPDETLESLAHLKSACRDAGVEIWDHHSHDVSKEDLTPTVKTGGIFCIPLLGQTLEFPSEAGPL